MTWKEIIEEFNRLPRHFRDLDAVVTIEKSDGEHDYYKIVEICSRGLGGRSGWLGPGEDNPRNNYEYDLTIWTDPAKGESSDTLTDVRDRAIDSVLKNC